MLQKKKCLMYNVHIYPTKLFKKVRFIHAKTFALTAIILIDENQTVYLHYYILIYHK